MTRITCLLLFGLAACCLTPQTAAAQNQNDTSRFKTLPAGEEYKRSRVHQWLWGKNYRREWSTPVTVPIMMLDTAVGGLKIKKSGGGNQTKSLHLETGNEKVYGLRSVNKTLGKVLPEEFKETFIEDIVDDLVSMSHPYGALAVPGMARAARVSHTYPQYYYLPQQPRLDSFNERFANDLYLFEQRASGNWSDAANLGSFSDFDDTYDIMDDMLDDNQIKVDQRAFVRARLFDMLLGDWDRHEDQWKWGQQKTSSGKLYTPVPSDRDQAFSKHGGLFVNLAMGASGIDYMQSFGDDLKDVTSFNFEQRGIDRWFINELTLSDWQAIARDLQQSLPDPVIEGSVKNIPNEIYNVSGSQIVSSLKSRRDKLVEWATQYYLFLAEETEVVGSKKPEMFVVNRLDPDKVLVEQYRLKNGNKIGSPLYSRVFNSSETNEIRIYGISGEDKFEMTGTSDNPTVVRIIGGMDADSIIDRTTGGGRTHNHIYDNFDNQLQVSNGTRLHLTSDTAVHSFRYRSFQYDKKGISPTIFYNSMDKLFVGLSYKNTHYKWRHTPFAFQQKMSVHYSLSQRAFSVWYDALVPKAFGKTDLVLRGYYDQVVWIFFYGLGNQTPSVTNDRDFYRMRTSEGFVGVGLHRGWGRSHVNLGTNFSTYKIINDEERYVAKNLGYINDLFDTKRFAGAQLSYSTHMLNDSVVPTKGFFFTALANFAQNIDENKRSIFKYGGAFQWFLPLSRKLSYGFETGGSTVSGTPELYQYASLGGNDMRGYRRSRFWGKTAFYQSNDLRFITDVKGYYYRGKVGFFGFFDHGRVWLPGETSNEWHYSFGPGIIIAPFNKIAATVTYGINPDRPLIQLQVGKYF